MSSSIVEPITAKIQFRPAWSQCLGARPRGLKLARERQWTLAWDEKDCLYLFNGKGERQAQLRAPAPLAVACCAEDGSAYAAAGQRGEIWWLAPDLSLRWESSLGQRPTAAAVDALGQYLVVADNRSQLHYFDRHGRSLGRTQTQRPFHHLAFIPEAPYVVGSADYGLVAAYDLSGKCAWRDGLVTNIGALALSGDGQCILLACFSEGLHCYDLSGKKKPRLQGSDACRLAAVSYDGRFILTAALSNRICLLNSKGGLLGDHLLAAPPLALALGALGDNAVTALADGSITWLEIRA